MEKTAGKVVSHDEWLAARKKFLAKEKEFTRQRDELSRLRRELPWEKVEKKYMFNGANGKETLASLFDGRSQLLIYHFMFGPGWNEGCPSCSFLADAFDAIHPHITQRDTTFVAVSRATLPEIDAFKKRMGWKFKWVSSNGTDFNYDYNVSFTKEQVSGGNPIFNYGTIPAYGEETPGASAFIQKDGEIFHTYSTYARGLDILLPMYNWIDLTAMGRHEEGMKPHEMAWVRHHDRYSDGKMVDVGKLIAK
ncbi:MAG: DUF899 domain-containing protein [Acidobacteria bacterium]|nr:MAG: DUF899 domain-containing protein [Acidobacteriota bacterium]